MRNHVNSRVGGLEETEKARRHFGISESRAVRAERGQPNPRSQRVRMEYRLSQAGPDEGEETRQQRRWRMSHG